MFKSQITDFFRSVLKSCEPHSSQVSERPQDGNGHKLEISADSEGGLPSAEHSEQLQEELIRRGQMARSILLAASVDTEPAPEANDSVHADTWTAGDYCSLFDRPDEEQCDTSEDTDNSCEFEEDFDMEEDLLPFFSERLLLYEDEMSPVYDLDQVNEQGTQTAADRVAEQSLETQTAEMPQAQPYRNFSEHALKIIAQKPDTSTLGLIYLATHKNPHVRAAVALNPHAPESVIIMLAKDFECAIRHSIAENPKSPASALRLLLNDRNQLIAWRAQSTLKQMSNPKQDSKSVSV